MALQGDLATLPVRQLLTWLSGQRATGQLSLSQAMVVRRFHLREGRVTLASSSEEPNLLGRLLIERGLVTEDQLARVLDDRGRGRPRLGKALCEAGLVSAPALAQVLAQKVERLLTGALTWTEGSFYFDDAAPARRQAAVSTSVDLAAVVARTDHDAVPVTDADVLTSEVLAGPMNDGPSARVRRSGASARKPSRSGRPRAA